MPNKLNEKLDEIENVNDSHENDPHKLIKTTCLQDLISRIM
jgi:hypothetical protein